MALTRIEPPRRLPGALALLACPTQRERSVSARIGAEGGMLAVDGHIVRVPAGAVTEARMFTLTVPASAVLQLQLSAADIDHLKRDLEVTISLARCHRQDLERRALRVLGFAEDEGLVESDPVAADVAEGVLTTLIASRSTYAVAY